jgi:translation elongation factor EF-G
MTEGRGSMVMEFDHYDIVPQNVAEEIKKTRG